MSETDMALAREAEEEARIAAEVKAAEAARIAEAKAKAEAAALAAKQAEMEAEAAAKAKAEADARAAEQARLAEAAAAEAKAKADAAAEIVKRDKLVSSVFEGALTGIQFNTGQNSFASSSYSIMDQVVSVMNQYPNLSVTIEGHTDSVGSREPNRKLSQKRADAVKAYLISKGISATRLDAIGYGEAQPIADNRYKEGRAKNRRVVFVPSYN